MEEVETVVIGAGPGGLGTAGLLSEHQRGVVLLERGDGVGNKWRHAYDRLHINTSTLTSYLPRRRFPRATGMWPSRDQLVDYYEDFARSREIDVRLGVTATAIHAENGSWRVQCNGSGFIARSVVVAVGRDGEPAVPEWPGCDEFAGTLLHSSQYKNAAPFAGTSALVVGVGNSGSDIAVDLLEGGAASVSVAVRAAPHMIKRSVAGIPNDVLQVITRRLPTAFVDRAGELVRRKNYRDLEPLGLGRPNTGIKTYVKTQARVPTIDSGSFSAAVREKRVRIVPALTRLGKSGAILSDGSLLSADVIVAATGYTPALAPLVGHLGILNDRGWPSWSPAVTDKGTPGLYIVGFGDPTRGNLRGLRMDAHFVAKHVLS